MLAARFGVCFALLACLPAGAARSTALLSACSTELPPGVDACRERVAAALDRDGYGEVSAIDGGWRAASSTHAIAVVCVDARDHIIANLVLAGDTDAGGECARLAQVLRGDARNAKGRSIEVRVDPSGRIVLSWHDTPGDDSDWITVQPADSPDDQYNLFWTYVGPKRSGSRELGPLRSGYYEARLYLDWPKGQYVVHERLAFEVPLH